MVVIQTFIKTAAVSGIAFVWVNFTVESLKMAWHIISTSPETCEPVDCKEKLSQCKEELSQCKEELTQCKEELSQCKEELSQ